MTSIFIQKGDRGFIFSKIMRIWRRKKVDDTGCVGFNVTDDKLKNIQEAMESEMKKYTLNDLRSGMQELLAKEA